MRLQLTKEEECTLIQLSSLHSSKFCVGKIYKFCVYLFEVIYLQWALNILRIQFSFTLASLVVVWCFRSTLDSARNNFGLCLVSAASLAGVSVVLY